MQFKSYFTSTPFSAAGAVTSELQVFDPSHGGKLEHLEEKIERLQRLCAAMVEVLTEEQQIGLVAIFTPAYKPVQEE